MHFVQDDDSSMKEEKTRLVLIHCEYQSSIFITKAKNFKKTLAEVL